MISCKPHPLPSDVVSAVSGLVKPQPCRLFALVGGRAFDRQLVDQVFRERSSLDGVQTLDVLLDSSGGDLEAAYQLVVLFRKRCQKLRVIIPDWAKSAATFFCLGADEIWMSETAELGPLDAQIPDPRDPDSTISALDEFRAIDYLRTYAFETLDQFVMLLIRRTRMGVKNILAEARQYVTQLTAPLYGQVDPLYFGASHRALEMAREYGRRVMARYAYKHWPTEKVDTLLDELTWQYPSHSFVIDYHEAQRLGLNVYLLSGEREDWAHTIVNSVQECIGFLDVELAAQLGTTEPGASRGEGAKAESERDDGSSEG